jgi:chorismate mutase
MNGISSRWAQERPEQPSTIETREHEIQAMEAVHHDRRPLIILSSLEGTLEDGMGFDSEMIEAAHDKTVVVATSRSADHPLVAEMWQNGLVNPSTPIIAESGNVLVSRHADGTTHTTERKRQGVWSGFVKILGQSALTPADVFVIGMGSAKGDAPIFKGADLSIGVTEGVADKVDIPMKRGTESAKLVLTRSANVEFVEIQPAAAALNKLRKQIDNIDQEIISVLAQRFNLTEQVGLLKAQHGLDAVDKRREKAQHARIRSLARQQGISPEMLEDIWTTIISEVVVNHKKLRGEQDE